MYGMLRYATDDRAERRKRSRGDGSGGGCGSGRTEGEADRAINTYTYEAPRPRARISIAHGRAPPICAVRGRISRPLDKRERHSDNNLLWLCAATSVRAGFGRCFDGE
jgi:hypothetical protein